jgi:tricarballylate dehydrogenase
MEQFDVIVVGGGNAALCAAIAARQTGARVLVLERAPQHMRGGNTRHTRNMRCAHNAADQFFSGSYREDEYLDDLISIAGDPANMDLAKLTVRESAKLPQWMSQQGASWQQPLAGTLHLGRTNRWFLGGGKTLLNGYYRRAAEMGIEVRYDALVEDLVIEDSRFDGAIVKCQSGTEMIRAGAVVIAAGGFEANLGWLKTYWGDAVDNFIVRGTPYNDGTALATLLKRGAKSVGDPKAFHAVAVDARAPKYDGGIVTRLDAIPFGIVVNRLARRFHDEGENLWPKRYASWGGLIATQPEQLAYSIVDSKTIRGFLPPVFKPYQSDTLEGLAKVLNLDPRAFMQTMTEFNRGAAGNSSVRMEMLDGSGTRGVTPPKTNWALPIDTAPFYGFPLRTGVTFTYMGVAIDEVARVLDQSGQAFENVYAAGEIVSGNILTKGYLAGIGMTIGAIFGQIAGREAAKHASS